LPLAWLFFLLQYTTEINPSKIIGTLITAFRTANGKARFDTSKVAWNETKVAERKAMVMHTLEKLGVDVAACVSPAEGTHPDAVRSYWAETLAPALKHFTASTGTSSSSSTGTSSSTSTDTASSDSTDTTTTTPTSQEAPLHA
jgi:hypothetical protein